MEISGKIQNLIYFQPGWRHPPNNGPAEEEFGRSGQASGGRIGCGRRGCFLWLMMVDDG